MDWSSPPSQRPSIRDTLQVQLRTQPGRRFGCEATVTVLSIDHLCTVRQTAKEETRLNFRADAMKRFQGAAECRDQVLRPVINRVTCSC